MRITAEDILKIASLARLELTPEEVEKMLKDMESILGYIGQLNELNTEDIAPTAHSQELKNVMREDLVSPFSGREEIMKNAPEEEDGYFRVKRVVD